MNNLETIRRGLLSLDVTTRLKELSELYKHADVFLTPQLPRILEALFPVFQMMLRTQIPPQFIANDKNRCRKLTLQILNRLPYNEALKPYASRLLHLLMEVLTVDNVDNCLIALKTIFDLHRNYRPGLKNEVQPFLEQSQKMYKSIQLIMKKQFSGPPEPPLAPIGTHATQTNTTTQSNKATKNESMDNHAHDESQMESKDEDMGETKEETTNTHVVAAPTPEIAPKDVQLCPGIESFKTMAEFPLIIMLLFQCYPNYIENYIPILVPLMMSTLSLRCLEAAPKLYPSKYVDFLDCQVKTLSFVTYLLRGFSNLMRPFQDTICENTVKLLIACPKDAFVLRKDIFVAARHILSTDFRRGFYPQLEILMDDEVLIGKGRCSYYQIRPLAYSTLADMIHHVRDMLTLQQVSKIVSFYGKRIHDPTLPVPIQTTAIRLLLNLVDISAKNEEHDGWRGRNILSRILLTIATKFGTTLHSLPIVLSMTSMESTDRHIDPLEGGAMDKIKQSDLVPKPVEQLSEVDAKLKALLAPYERMQRSYVGLPEEEPTLRDVKSLLRTMILGIRAVIWCTANYRNPHAKDLTSMDTASLASTSSDVVEPHLYPLTDDERALITKVLLNGLRCFILYTLSDSSVSEEKQMLDHFAGAFTVLDAPDFRDLFLSNIKLLYDCILQDHAILTIPQHFLANANVSCWFAEILLNFLVTQMDVLGVECDGDVPDMSRHDKIISMESLVFENMRQVPKAHKASIVLRLFKIVFGSVTLFKSNESALFPHLKTIIVSCLTKATETPYPDNYLLLLRALFRSISGVKFENFYKEVLPLLPGLLSALMRLQKHIKKPSLQDVLLELCLTIPARLSSLLQYLPSLMRSVVQAMLSRGELANLGLRTLEYWVDNLNPDFLYPIMTSQERLLTEIIEALNSHLHPPPYPYGELAMRILGKIGGRNRQFLTDAIHVEHKSTNIDGANVQLKWENDALLVLPLEPHIDHVSSLLKQYANRHKSAKSETPPPRHDSSSATTVPEDTIDEGDIPESVSMVLEKDDKTLALEAGTVQSVHATVLDQKLQAFSFLKHVLAVILRIDELDFSTISYVGCQPPTPLESKSIAVDLEECYSSTCNYPTPSKEKVIAEQFVLKKVLQTLFECVADVDLATNALEIMRSICILFTTTVVSHSHRKSPNPEILQTLVKAAILPGSRGLSPGRMLGTSARLEVYREAYYGLPVMDENIALSLDPFVLFEVIVDVLSDSDDRVVDVGRQALSFVLDTALAVCDNDAVKMCDQGGALLNGICEVCTHTCYDKSSWRNKLGGARGLALLIEKLPPHWCRENEISIVRSLLFVLADHPTEVTAGVSEEAGTTFIALLRKCHDQFSSVPKMNDIDMLDIIEETKSDLAIDIDTPTIPITPNLSDYNIELLLLLISELLSSSTPVRTYVKQAVNLFAELTGIAVSSLLQPYHQVLAKQIMGTSLRLLPLGTRTGYIDGMAYCLTLQPPLFTLNKDLLIFLQEVWSLVSDDTQPSSPTENTATIPTLSENLNGQEYPFGISQMCQLRIAAIQLLRAAFVNDDLLHQHQDARNRFVGVFFKYLTGQPPILLECAQNALTDVIMMNKRNNERSLPKELLQQCLRPVLLNLADYRKLTIPLLEGLGRLLGLLSSCFNVTLGEKLLEHLRQWRDPERIIKAAIWKRGDEPNVAAAIVDLFHLLPPSDTFLEPLVSCVVELEAVLPKYGSFGKLSSPYRTPLVRFLNRYANQAVNYFLKREHLIDNTHSALFQCLIKLPLADPVRAVLVSDVGTEAIINATFASTSKSAMSTPPDIATKAASEEDVKLQAQIQLGAQKAASQAIAAATAQGLSASAAEQKGKVARAAFLAKSHGAHIMRGQTQVQIQATAQKLHAQTLVTAQAQGLSLAQAQARAQQAMKDYIAKHLQMSPSPVSMATMSGALSTQQQAQIHAQLQLNAQKVHAQALAEAKAKGLKPAEAQERAKQAQSQYVHLAKQQAQQKMALQQGQIPVLVSPSSAPASAPATPSPYTTKPQQEALELHYQGLRLVRTLSKMVPNWLAMNNGMIEQLRKLWRSPSRVQRLLSQDRLQIRYHLESKLLVKCLIQYCRANPEDVQVLLDMLTVFLHRTSFDFSFLRAFYRDEVAAGYSTANKRSIIHLFLRMLRDTTLSEELKVHAIQLLIMPLLNTSFDDPDTNNAEVMDPDAVMLMLREILASKDYPQDTFQALRIELLKLGTLLIQHMSRYVTDHRKEVIKFAWNHLKAQDLTSKLWAYVNVCRFISVYDTPPKIVLQVYVALLRTYEMDSRFLVRKAFDILLPALPTRLPPHEFIKAIKWTKKIAFEEGHILQQLVHIWYLIVRQPSLFYPFRGQFIPLMVNSLNRLAIPPSSTQDNRRLAVSVVDLVIAWETTRRQRVQDKGKPSSKRPLDASSTSESEKRQKVGEDSTFVPGAPAQPSTESEVETLVLNEDDFELTGAMTDLIVNFAFRFALACADKQETNRLSKTCGELFYRALHLWPSASIRFSYFDKLIAVTAEVIILQAKSAPSTDPSSQSMPSFLSVPKGAPLASLAILNAVLGILNTLISPQVIAESNRAVPYVVQYAPRIMKLLEPCFDRQNNEVQHQLALYLQRMVQLYPPDSAPPQLVTCKFYTWLRDILNERLLKAAAIPNDATPLGSLGAMNSPTSLLKAKAKATPLGKIDTPKPTGSPTLSTQAAGQSALSPMINHEAARMRLLFANSPSMPSRLSSPGSYILKILSDLAFASAKFMDMFAPALTKLAQRLTKEHLQHVVSLAKPPSSLEGSIGGTDVGVSAGAHSKDRVMATPSLAIMNEYLQLKQGRSSLTVNNTVRTKKSKEDLKMNPKKKLVVDGTRDKLMKTPQLVKKRSVPTSSAIVGRKVFMDMLISCFKLLAKCTFESSELARLFVNLMTHCLEHSSHIPLLLEITKIVSKMVADDGSSVFTMKDKVSLLGKMATFDRLNEISAQPLLAEYHAMVLAICANSESNPLYATITGSYMTGLLSSDINLRRQFFIHFEKMSGSTTTTKLKYLLEQDWQSCGTRYWPVVAIELLLKSVQTTVRPICTSSSLPPVATLEGPNATLQAADWWKEHISFLATWRNVSSADIIAPICSIVQVNLDMANQLWATVYPQAWSLMTPAELTVPTQNLMQLLSMRYHRRELRLPVSNSSRHNVIQTLMEGIMNAYPMPVFTAELLFYLANTYNVWGQVARICEYQVASPATTAEDRERWVDVLNSIYAELNEYDWQVGLNVQACEKPETRMALYLQAQGHISEAQEVYFQAISNASKALKIETSAFEIKVLETQWISCVNSLCQWSLMNDFAKATQNQELLLDCCWKRGDWTTTKQLMHASSIQAASEAGSPSLRLKKLYAAILDGDKKPHIDALASQIVDLTLHQWQGLPRILSNAHIPLLHLFHQFVEVKESIQMMTDIKLASQQHNLPNLKSSINTWRERLPNKHDPILLWDDILTWRSHMFNVVKSTFSWSDAQHLACMHDSPWSIVKMAHTARKQQLPEVCLHALSQLYTIPAMDVQDAFSKLREQVSICYETTKEYKGGLSLLNNTNLDYFDARQKAELFRLKGLFMEALGEMSDANQAFSHCLQLCDSYGKGWLSWGRYCDTLFNERKEIEFAAQTIACYLQAVHHRSSSARLYLARVLWLLSMDNDNGVLIHAFETHGKQLPIWIWIIWIPQLLMSLCRPEAPQIRGLLRGLSAKFPQALYYTMRAFFLENRELFSTDKEKMMQSAPPTPLSSQTTPKSGMTMSNTDTMYYRTKSGHVVGVPITHEHVQDIPGLVGASRSAPSHFGPSTNVLTLEVWLEKVANGELMKTDMSPLQYTEDLLNFLRRSHDALAFEMECMLEEMIVRFRPEPEEELLTAVHALLLKCYQLPSFAKNESVPKMLKDTLSRVCNKFFILQPHQKSDKHIAFVDEYKEPFEKNFMLSEDENDPSAPTLSDVMDKLKLWKHVLQIRVKRYGKRNADKVLLEHSSRHLVELRQTAVEIPGQYLSNAEPIKELHARLQYFHSTTDILLRNGYTQRRITLGGSNGKQYSFLVQYAMTYITRCDERMMQMHLLMNRLFLRHKETKVRNLVFQIPKVIPLTPRVRLIEDNFEHISLGEIYELDCAVQKKDPDFPVEFYRQKISQVEENLTNMKMAIYNEICEQHVSETLLAKYLHRTIPHYDDLFLFRNVFTSHLALTSFLAYVMHVGERTPHKTIFSQDSGRVISCEIRPNYASSGIIESSCVMPFRLSRNLQSFVTSNGIEGPFTIAMAAAAQALMSEQHHDITMNQLCLFFRDDLLSWHTSKTKSRLEHTHADTHRQSMIEHQVRHRVDANVKVVAERISNLAPKPAKQVSPTAPSAIQELIATATSTETLSQIYPTWFPWL
ncbi:phosphatidylinositol kinase (PIK-L3) [Thraustotheca clavata]|uniref:Phosphatidylinositol kinase (PIK-L3) n=1 Tax=Thraustotheca clavata TaxID=74557 RepID=A0A1V9ZBZ5_9STRA|nr:phosphatidylinositol kinase (PIK-L3) [Thraustotheca clavata]